MSLQDIAEATSIPKSTVSSYEDGRAKNPKEENLKKIADLFRVTVPELVFKKIGQFPEATNRIELPPNFDKKTTYKLKGGNLSVNDLILMTIEQLYKLQAEQEDGAAIKAIAQVITYKQYAESLERENKLLKEIIEMQREKINQK